MFNQLPKETGWEGWQGYLPWMLSWIRWSSFWRCLMEPEMATKWGVGKPLGWCWCIPTSSNSWSCCKATWTVSERSISHLQANGWWPLGCQYDRSVEWPWILVIPRSIKSSWCFVGGCLPRFQSLCETRVAGSPSCQHQELYPGIIALAKDQDIPLWSFQGVRLHADDSLDGKTDSEGSLHERNQQETRSQLDWWPSASLAQTVPREHLVGEHGICGVFPHFAHSRCLAFQANITAVGSTLLQIHQQLQCVGALVSWSGVEAFYFGALSPLLPPLRCWCQCQTSGARFPYLVPKPGQLRDGRRFCGEDFTTESCSPCLHHYATNTTEILNQGLVCFHGSGLGSKWLH